MQENGERNLRSEEVREIMNRIPPIIQRWGITIMAIILTILCFIANYIKIPIVEECNFVMAWQKGEGKPMNMIYLSTSSLQSILYSDTTQVILQSEQFPIEYSSGIPIALSSNNICSNSMGTYEVIFETPPEIKSYIYRYRLSISGSANIVVSRKTLVESLVESLLVK